MESRAWSGRATQLISLDCSNQTRYWVLLLSFPHKCLPLRQGRMGAMLLMDKVLHRGWTNPSEWDKPISTTYHWCEMLDFVNPQMVPARLRAECRNRIPGVLDRQASARRHICPSQARHAVLFDVEVSGLLVAFYLANLLSDAPWPCVSMFTCQVAAVSQSHSRQRRPLAS